MRHMIWVVLLSVGCGESGELAALKASLRVSEENVAKSTQAVEVKQDEAVSILKDNTASLARIEKQLEASLVKSASQQTGGDPKASPEPPAKANTQQTPVQVATPGASSETLVELATRLYAQGVNTNMKTREELEAIDAQLNGGQPVTGAMFQNNRTSSITSKRNAVRFVPRRSGVVQWQNYSTQSTCGPNGCPSR